MELSFWKQSDFDVFNVEGLEQRMEQLRSQIGPKFELLGTHFSNLFSAHGTGEFIPHIAKHARRTVNPPTDSWVAFAPSKRGYKALPHFQIGLWETHLFIVLAVIYENPDKKGIAERLLHNKKIVGQLPSDFIISGDHTKPDAELITDIGADGTDALFERLKTVKKAELLIGRHLPANEAVSMSEKEFFCFAEDTMKQLLPVYDIVINRINSYQTLKV